IVCPAPVNIDGLADFTMDMAIADTLTVSLLVSVSPVGVLPSAVARSAVRRVGRASWVVTCVAVQLVDASGADVSACHTAIDPNLSSVRVTVFNVTLRVLVTL